MVTDLDASGGFNHNLTFNNLTDLMQGFMFADIRRQGYEVVSAVVDGGGSADTYAVDETEDFFVNSLIFAENFDVAANNGLNVVTAVSADASVAVVTGTLGAEASPPADASVRVVGYVGALGTIDVNVAGDLPILTHSGGGGVDFTTLGIVVGQWIYIGGDDAGSRFTNEVNNGFKRVRAVTATTITIDKSYDTMVTESDGIKTVHIYIGDVLKNELAGLIVRRSYHLERLLGAPDDDNPEDLQTEIIKGAIPNEFTLNIPSADLLNVDMSFMATDNEQRDSTQGPKQTGVVTVGGFDEYNTSSDVGRIRMSLVSDTNEAPTALFAYVTEASIMINNNLSMNKAVGVLGAFDVTAGTFEVGGDITAYFTNVTAVRAVRNNSDVTLDISFVKDNTGIIFDLPLISLGNARLEIEIDEPIMLPLETNAARGRDVDPNMDHTLLITYFNYLPDVAM